MEKLMIRQERGAEEQKGLCKGKILIVDDMPIHLETAGFYLEMSGYEALYASDVQQAWRLVCNEKPAWFYWTWLRPVKTAWS